jgi:uncharacterized integral membrane protein
MRSGEITRYLVWLFRAVLFLFLLTFAIKNGKESATLHYFFGYEWNTSLLVVLLLFFAVGMFFGVLAPFGLLFRQRREIAALKKELKKNVADKTGNDSAPTTP